ncbi:MAG: hypothetical protein ACRC67_26700 [Inquilinus sp.]|uniref:hypothetical protein n=1 Tax=Inquilinus sp. TaxID=1932117 RepID=UPI003F2CAEAF
MVEPDGAGYRVTWPALSGSLTRASAAKAQAVRFRCAPDRSTGVRLSEGVYRLSSDGPSDCVLETGDGRSFRFTSRTRHEDSVVDLAQGAFTEWSAMRQDVTIQAVNGRAEPIFSIARSETSGRGTPGGRPGRRDVVERSTAEDVRFTFPGAAGGFTASRIDGESQLFDYGFDGVVRRSAELMRMVDLASEQQRDPKAADIPAQAMLSFVQGLGSRGDRFRSSATYSGYRVTSPQGPVDIETLSFGVDAEGIDSDSGSGRVTFTASGLSLGSMPSLADWALRDITVSVAATSVPFKSLLQAIESDPTSAVVPRLAALLGQAGSRLEVETARLNMMRGSLDLHGSIRADAKAPRGVSGAATARLTGLGPLATFLRSRPQTERMADRVTAVEALGRAVDLDAGTTARDYDIKLGGEPVLLVNGVDPTVILQDAGP